MGKPEKSIFYALVISVLFSACGGSNAPGTGDADSVKTIRPVTAADAKIAGLYRTKCAVCHGADGTAGIGNAANLQTSRLDSASIKQILTAGKGAMPAFGKDLTETQIRQTIAFVRGLRW